MNKWLRIFISAITLLSGCKDDAPDYEQTFNSYNLVIGDLSADRLLYEDLSPGLVLNPQPGESKTILLDINKDGVTDFRIASSISVNVADTSTTSSIIGLDSAEVGTIETWETWYLYYDTINGVALAHQENQPDTPLLSNPAVFFRPGATYAKVHDENDTISQNADLWASVCAITWQHFGSDTTDDGYPNIYDLRFGAWSGAGTKYIAFKLIHDGKTYYGWMKMEVINYTRIVVSEYAYKQITEI